MESLSVNDLWQLQLFGQCIIVLNMVAGTGSEQYVIDPSYFTNSPYLLMFKQSQKFTKTELLLVNLMVDFRIL